MNRKDIRDLVIETTGRADKTTLINSAINIALAKVSTSRLWNDLLTDGSVTLVVDALSASLDSNLRRLSEARLIDGSSSYKLQIRNKNWIKRKFPDISSMSSGKPVFGYIQGTTLFFLPPTDTALDIEYSYFRMHPNFTDDTTESLIQQADEALISYTTYWIFKSLQMHDDAREWFADYQVQLADAKQSDISPAEESISDPRSRGVSSSSGANAWLDPFVFSTAGHSGFGF